VLLQVRVIGGTPPYTYTWYVNGQKLPTSNTSSKIVIRNLDAGENQVSVVIEDSAGYTIITKLFTIDVVTPQTIITYSPTPSLSRSPSSD